MVFIDQLHRQVEIVSPFKRIISLVPSQTELLFYLGLSDCIAGITKFCVHPQPLVKTIPKVGGTKNLRSDVIDRLKPDLIIANKEENDRASIDQLQAKYPVWVSDVSCYHDAISMIKAIGTLTDREGQASALIKEIESRFEKIVLKRPSRVVYLIWREPWMAVGISTYIDSMLTKIGFQNVVEEARYPTISGQQLQQLRPDVVFLSSEPYPFKQDHIFELRQLLPHSKVVLVDGEMFSWYGSRMLLAPDYFASLNLQ